jgi:hypothetical protein
MARTVKTTPATPAAPTRESVSQKVVNLRNVGLMSWAQIGAEVGVAPRTARRLYQESEGAHSHHGLLPGRGGRLPVGFVTTDEAALVKPGSGTWVPRTDPAEGVAGTKGSAVVVPATPATPAPKRSRKPKASA